MKRHTYYLLDKKHEAASFARELMVDLTKPTNENWWYKDLYGLQVKVLTSSDITEHIANKNNPHRVTRAQIGLSDVVNIRQVSLEDFLKHINNFNNPHMVNKDHVGLSLIPNEELMSVEEFKKKKELVQKHINIVEDLIDEVYKKNKIPEYTLTVDKTPQDIQVFIFTKGEFVNSDNITKLRFGFYNYQIRYNELKPIDGTFLMPMEDYTLVCKLDSLLLVFNVNIENAKVEVYSNGNWISSANYKFHLMEGRYQYRVTKDHYNTIEGNAHVIAKINTVNINMEKTIYNVEIELKSTDFRFKLQVENEWTQGLKYNLPYGEYAYKVITPTKEVPGKIIIDHSGIYKIDIEIEMFNVLINTIPEDAIVKLYINGTMKVGKQFLIPNNDYPINITAGGYKEINDVLDVYRDEVFEFNMELKELSLNVTLLTPGSRFYAYINNEWIEGIQFSLFKGSYQVKCECDGFDTYTSTIELVDKDIYLTVDLKAKKYPVNFVLDGDGYSITVVNIYTNENLPIEDKTCQCTIGNYRYSIAKPYHKLITGEFRIIDQGKTIQHTLELAEYSITVVPDPSDAILYIKNQDQWEEIDKTFTKTYGEYSFKLSSNSGWAVLDQTFKGYQDLEFKINIDSSKTVNKKLVPNKVLVNFITTPNDATVVINGEENLNNTEFDFMSTIEARIYREGYEDHVTSVLLDSPKEINVELKNAKCKVNLYTIEEDIIPKIYVGDKWVEAKDLIIPSGTYKYKVDISEFKQLSIYTNEESARVYIKYKDKWVQISTLDLPHGEYEYEVDFGDNPDKTDIRDTITLKRLVPFSKYRSIPETDLTILKDTDLNIELELVDSPTIEDSGNMGTINIKTIAPCAIFIKDSNGNLYPNNTRLPYGNYTIITRSNIYKLKETNIVLDSELYDRYVDIDDPKYALTINTPNGVIVYIDDVQGNSQMVYTGSHIVRVEGKYYLSITQTVEIETEAKTVDITPDRLKATLSFINLLEGSTIELKLDNTTIVPYISNTEKIPQGLYNLKVSKEGYFDYISTLDVDRSETSHEVLMTPIEYGLTITPDIDDCIIYIYHNNLGYPNGRYFTPNSKLDYIVIKEGYRNKYGTIEAISEDTNIAVNMVQGENVRYKVKFNFNIEDGKVEYMVGVGRLLYSNTDESDLLEGIYVFVFSKEGYTTITKTIIIDKNTTEDITLEQE